MLHEHLGISNYVRIIAQVLCSNQMSIVMPNLFEEVEENSNNSVDDVQFIKNMAQPLIAETVY